MNTRTAVTLALLAAPSVMLAGEAEYTNTTTTTSAPPSYSSDHVGWYLGGGVDYFFDAEEPFYNGHLGYDFGGGHSLFLESGWLGTEEFVFPFNVDIDIVPITLNYKYEYMFNERFGLYAGLGAGASNVDVNVGFVSDDDWTLTAQAFAGLVYNVSENFEIYGGARYLWIDDPDLFGATFDKFDDVSAGVGVRFNF
ncbi:porin family protein [Luteolibacter sp. GHJ8]|uniref:Porin family protein n=1 Tax=Luteolibacter rhizosphaerae TaxID=2989719 RepID=A0ABT3FYQ9_9BACT|nr:porin family protein [Luteolibacter rhizosphaerae]MCW1912140.1 porin family protein [Luteolibacter rhizosphaerae]